MTRYSKAGRVGVLIESMRDMVVSIAPPFGADIARFKVDYTLKTNHATIRTLPINSQMLLMVKNIQSQEVTGFHFLLRELKMTATKAWQF